MRDTGVGRRAAVAAAVALAVLLAGCGGDDPGGDEPTGGGVESTSSEATPSGPPPGAATGPEISTDSVTLRVPEGWEQPRRINSDTVASSPRSSLVVTVFVSDFVSSTGGEAKPLDELARDDIDADGEPVDPEILPETEIAGVPVFHTAGDVAPDLYQETFGPALSDRVVTISFEFLSAIFDKRRQKIIDEVLASVEWTY